MSADVARRGGAAPRWCSQFGGGRKRTRFAAGLGAVVAAVLSIVPAAQAWDPATTQAGLTERALLASSFHKVLSRRLGRPLGALEPLQLHSRLLSPEQRRGLWARFGALDPAGGYRPGDDGVASALAWVTAGAVLSETPPERGRNHFFDPSRGSGLEDGRGLAGAVHALRLAMDAGGTVRGLATGTVFSLSGTASLKWVLSPDNDQGLVAFHRHLVTSVAGADPALREAALVRALLALGGILAALEDAGEPAHVRGDFRRAFLQAQGSSTWDRASSFERFVARRYGRVGVPAPAAPVRRPTLESYFSAPDGEGLADRTQRRFFSEGTLPETVAVDAKTTPREVIQTARASLAYPRPTVSGLNLRDVGPTRYVLQEGRRVLAYQRTATRVRFFLDAAVYGDAARALLPEVAAYAAGLTDHLLRGAITFGVEGRNVELALEGVAGDRAEGTLRLFVEDRGGQRREIPSAASGRRTFKSGPLFTLEVPEGTRRIAAVLEGQDGAGEVVAVGEASLP
jgi:hypothetical protein